MFVKHAVGVGRPKPVSSQLLAIAIAPDAANEQRFVKLSADGQTIMWRAVDADDSKAKTLTMSTVQRVRPSSKLRCLTRCKQIELGHGSKVLQKSGKPGTEDRCFSLIAAGVDAHSLVVAPLLHYVCRPLS